MPVNAPHVLEPAVTDPHHGGARHSENLDVELVILHDEEYQLADDSAERIAAYFAQANHGPSCAHYVVDANSERHCGHDDELLYHAPPNRHTIGIERDGYASWSLEQWHQANAVMTTCRQAARAAALCVRYGLGTAFVDAAGQVARRTGWSTHSERSKAFGMSTHTDPGPAFPIAEVGHLITTAAAWFVTPTTARTFQQSRGLTVDGLVGSQTVGAATLALYELVRDGAVTVDAGPTKLPPSPAPVDNAPRPAPTPAAPTPVHDVERLLVVRQGSRGESVRTLQGLLVAAGRSLYIDGIDGPTTTGVLRAWQAAAGLVVDGIAGPRTYSTMLGAADCAGMPVVRLGSRGQAARNVQGLLSARGFAVGVDGIVGPATIGALERFQRHAGIAADGIAGPNTYRKLLAL